jgi:hypothetical protein
MEKHLGNSEKPLGVWGEGMNTYPQHLYGPKFYPSHPRDIYLSRHSQIASGITNLLTNHKYLGICVWGKMKEEDWWNVRLLLMGWEIGKDLKAKISKLQLESSKVNLTYFTILPETKSAEKFTAVEK